MWETGSRDCWVKEMPDWRKWEQLIRIDIHFDSHHQYPLQSLSSLHFYQPGCNLVKREHPGHSLVCEDRIAMIMQDSTSRCCSGSAWETGWRGGRAALQCELMMVLPEANLQVANQRWCWPRSCSMLHVLGSWVTSALSPNDQGVTHAFDTRVA